MDMMSGSPSCVNRDSSCRPTLEVNSRGYSPCTATANANLLFTRHVCVFTVHGALPMVGVV